MIKQQDGRCFYCPNSIERGAHADHFIARVRCGVDAIENLVMTHAACNSDKKDLLAAPALVQRWAYRNQRDPGQLAAQAERYRWETEPARTTAVARSIYAHLPEGDLPFWAGIKTIVLGRASDAVRVL